MDKIYGFNQDKVILLAEEIRKLKDSEVKGSLTNSFRNFALKNGLSFGTVRNMYYALAKLSKEDVDFCKQYLGGSPIEIGNIEPFSKESEKDIIEKILQMKKQGVSVRKATFELANGDTKLALRYQNKFRTVVSKKPSALAYAIANIKEKNGEVAKSEIKSVCDIVPDVLLNKVKKEIDNIVLRISNSVRRENEYLKNQIAILEVENARLRLESLGDNSPKKKSALKYFTQSVNKDVLN